MSDTQRLDDLETALRELQREVEALRAELSRLSDPRAADSPPSDHAARIVPIDPESTASVGGSPPIPSAQVIEPRTPIAPVDSGLELPSRTESIHPPGAQVPAPAGYPEGAGALGAGSPLGGTPGGRVAGGTRPGSETIRPQAGTRPNPESRIRTPDLESLVGRYGTMALAALTIIMGVGTFLGWAIANGKIGPEMRVALGAMGAIAVAAIGWRLRSRGALRFGSTLLALALALIHVDAWGAGPYLGVVSPTVALVIAALASAALAGLALREGEQALFDVGVGGALGAPFVTSTGSGDVTTLLAYGWVVLAAGMYAMRDRAWRVAALLIAFGCWWYTGAALGIAADAAEWPRADAAAIFALACAWTALGVVRGEYRVIVAQAALMALLVSLFVEPIGRTPAYDIIPFAALGTVTTYATLRATPAEALTRTVVLPLGFLSAALSALPDAWTLHGAALALAWAGGAVAMAVALDGARRGTHLMMAGIASAAAIVLGLDQHRVARIAALAAHAAAVSLLIRRERARALLTSAVGVLLLATAWSWELLDGRPAYMYTPFLTPASLAAAATSLGWLVFSWSTSRTEWADGTQWSPEFRTLVRLLGAAVAFLWGREELDRALSADMATFLLIAYYAAVGVGAIFMGRTRRVVTLRHLGLTIAVYAALKAVVQAAGLGIGLRVGSYFLAGLFMLAVAYWYRAEGGKQDGESRMVA